MKCFITECSSSYRKKLTENERRTSMFRPRTVEILNAWRKVLNESKELQMKDLICELHFKESDIERERTIYKRSGIVEQEIRKIPILKDKAVPCIFSAGQQLEKCYVKYKLPIDFKHDHRELCVKSKHNVKSEVPEKNTTQKGIKRESCTNEVNSAKPEKSFFKELVTYINTEFSFLPCSQLFVSHITDDCIILCWWSLDYSTMLKRLLIYKDGRAKIFIQQNEVRLPEWSTVNSVEGFSKVVQEVVELVECAKIDFINSAPGCPGYVIPKLAKVPGAISLRCSFCTKKYDCERKKGDDNHEQNLLLKKNVSLERRCKHLYEQKIQLLHTLHTFSLETPFCSLDREIQE